MTVIFKVKRKIIAAKLQVAPADLILIISIGLVDNIIFLIFIVNTAQGINVSGEEDYSRKSEFIFSQPFTETLQGLATVAHPVLFPGI